jgi:intracellular septation protein A
MTESAAEAVTAAPAPTLAGVARRIGWRGAADAVAPVLLFVGVDAAAGLVAAMAAATAWAVGLAAWRLAHRDRPGIWLWVALGYVVVRGVAGMLTQSKVVFFGPGVAQSGLIGLLFVVSVVARRPAVGYIAPVVYPFEDYVRRHPAYRRAFTRLTLIWAAYLLAHVVLDVWLLKSVSASAFVVIRSLVSWPMLVALFVFSLRYPRRVFRQEPDLVPYVEAAESPVPASAASVGPTSR